jgi:hypothetical protein
MKTAAVNIHGSIQQGVLLLKAQLLILFRIFVKNCHQSIKVKGLTAVNYKQGGQQRKK